MILLRKSSGHFASLSTRIPTAASMTQQQFHCSASKEDGISLAPICEGSPAQHPPTHLPQVSKVLPCLVHGAGCHIGLCLFCQDRVEGSCSQTYSLPLPFNLQPALAVSDSHPNGEGQEHYSDKNFMAIACCFAPSERSSQQKYTHALCPVTTQTS